MTFAVDAWDSSRMTVVGTRPHKMTVFATDVGYYRVDVAKTGR
jgi:hypothetical protein